MNHKFTIIILFVLGSFFVSKTNAQTVVTGIITDVNTGETLPGVTVKIEGTSLGVSTDSKGKYTLSIPSPNTKLVFSSIVYQPLRQLQLMAGQSISHLQIRLLVLKVSLQ